jgi:hypothetical protein
MIESAQATLGGIKVIKGAQTKLGGHEEKSQRSELLNNN